MAINPLFYMEGTDGESLNFEPKHLLEQHIKSYSLLRSILHLDSN